MQKKKYYVLVFHRVFTHELERNLFTFKVGSIGRCTIYNDIFLYCAMFVFKGADETWATLANSEEKVEYSNTLIIHHINSFDKDVEVLCKLSEDFF